ncbi:MAG: ABC transporter permease [Alphaproteobacteria bacterium TMED87]|nr:ABC transporter permease [Rhodospirillaceae bacterium]OUV09763.1 MAG: ABC transporter permease [Alphaproteobacteria bacterium TMED87]
MNLFFRNLSSVNKRRLANFYSNKRGYVSSKIILIILVMTFFSEFIANDKPLLISFKDHLYYPIIFDYQEIEFGGDFLTLADYRDPYLEDLINENGWLLWPPVRYSFDTINYGLDKPAPSPPSKENWLGTDSQARDVFARLLYGLRVSLIFGFVLTIISSVFGVIAGAVQGYFGGWFDLFFQRFIEIWSGLPQLFILIIVSSFLTPGFWTLLIILLLFSWTSLVPVVRAEFLRTRNLDYILAAKSLGISDGSIMIRHVLPNAMVATLTFLPFILSSSIIALTSLDFLGLGLPPGSPSLGEMLRQGKDNLHAPWLGITAFLTLAITLTLLVFMGEAIRDAFDPRKDMR